MEIKTDDRDQRVKALLTQKNKESKLRLLYAWASKELPEDIKELVANPKIDCKTFLDLVKIATREADLQEVAVDLRKLVNMFCKRNPDPAAEAKQFSKICERLPGLASKLEGVAASE